jgi:putative inorganic carbon (hco3(-)) transporter
MHSCWDWLQCQSLSEFALPEFATEPISGGTRHLSNAGKSKSFVIALTASLLAVLPIFAIAQPALLVPLGLLPVVILFVFRIPIWLCLGFVAFSFFRLHEAFPFLMPLHIPQMLALPTLLVLVWHIGVKKQVKPFWGPELTTFSVFFSIVTLGLPFASNFGIAFAYWNATYVKIGIMTVATAWVVRKETDFALALKVMVISGALVSMVAVSNKLAGIGLVEGTRVTIGRDFGSVLGDPNDLSLVLTFPLSFAVAMATTKHRWFLRLFGFAATGLIVWAVLCTQSRGGIIGTLAVFAVTGLRIVKSKLLLGGVGGLVGSVLFLFAGISDRSSGGASESGIDESAMGRIWAWTAAYNMALAKPFHGVGLDNFIPNFWLYTPHWTGFNKAVHSTWLGVLAETGFPGIIAFVVMVLMNVRVILVASRSLRDNNAPVSVTALSYAVLSGFAGFCGSGTFLTQGFTWPVYILIAFTAAVSHFAKQFALRDSMENKI